jgi:hypothetical protein
MAGANAANTAVHIVECCSSHGIMKSSFMQQPLPTGALSTFDVRYHETLDFFRIKGAL